MFFFSKVLNRSVAATLAGLLLSGTAVAQDWTGPFASLSLGQSQSQVDWTAGGTAIFAPAGYTDGGSAESTVLGAEVGQMYRRGDLLLGWSLGLTDLNHEESKPSPTFPLDTFATSIGPMLSLAGRLGRDQGDWMFYGEAGVAVAKIDVPNETPFCPTTCRLSLDGLSAGLVAGVGADYRISERYSVGINYRYVGFAERTASGMVSGLNAPQEYQIGGDASVLSLRLTIALD